MEKIVEESTSNNESDEYIEVEVFEKPKKKRGDGQESMKIREKIGCFDIKKSFAYQKLKEKFGNKIKQEELLDITNFICSKANLRIGRLEKRNKKVLYKWFEDNWEIISPVLSRINCFYRDCT